MSRRSSRAMWADKLAGKLKESSAVGVGLRKAYTGTVLGIDPSLRGTGLAVISFERDKIVKLHGSRTLKFHAKHSMYDCLGEIFCGVTEILGVAKVDHVAIEETIYVQNFQTAQVLGAARGAVIAAVMQKGIGISEYPPLRVKQAVVGYGRASKEQVIRTVMQYLGSGVALGSDEADAVAIAICHAFTWRG